MSRICLATIATAHGVKGLLKVLVHSDDPKAMSGYTFYTAESGDCERIKLIMKNSMGKYWLAAIDGLTDRTQAEKLRGTKLYVDRSDLPSTDEGEYYVKDLVGLQAQDQNGQAVGKIIDVQNFGAGDLMEIKPESADSFYMPFNDDYIGDVALDEGYVSVKNYESFM